VTVTFPNKVSPRNFQTTLVYGRSVGCSYKDVSEYFDSWDCSHYRNKSDITGVCHSSVNRRCSLNTVCCIITVTAIHYRDIGKSTAIVRRLRRVKIKMWKIPYERRSLRNGLLPPRTDGLHTSLLGCVSQCAMLCHQILVLELFVLSIYLVLLFTIPHSCDLYLLSWLHSPA
jgi:hypothetical protein